MAENVVVPSKKRRKTENNEKIGLTSSSWTLKMIEEAYAPLDAYEVARSNRARLRKEGKWQETESLQYGEIDCAEFGKLLRLLQPWLKTPKFLDIGMGTGKPVLVAASSGLFTSVTGVEVVSRLHEEAEATLRKLESAHGPPGPSVTLICDDCFNVSWQQLEPIGCVFLPITCFTEEMVKKVAERVRSLRLGTLLITTSTLTALDDKTLCGKALKKLHEDRYKYGKGTMKFSVYEMVE